MGYLHNVGSRYELAGRVCKGQHVTHYMLKDRLNDDLIKVEKVIVEQLALNNQIYNCRAQLYRDIVNLKGIGCRIKDLPKYSENGKLAKDDKHSILLDESQDEPNLMLVGKKYTGRDITNYLVVSLNDKDALMQITKESAFELAREGRFINAKTQMCKGKVILRGRNGYNISALQCY